MDKGYMISDASKLIEVENHVLRYWEEELELPIPRNEMGHRYYRESDIKLLRTVKDLKEQGFQLRAIKKLLPDLGRLEKMDPQGIYQLREELNRQVMQESMEGTRASVTSLNQARDRYEKRQRTWQERSYELEQARGRSVQIVPDSHRQVSMDRQSSMDRQTSMDRQASMDKLRQFEAMMRQMIRSTMEEMGRESEERICEAVTVKLQKEMNYLLMQKEELQEKQITLLKQILAQVKQEGAAPAGGSVDGEPEPGTDNTPAGEQTLEEAEDTEDTAAEAEREAAAAQDQGTGTLRNRKGREKKGLFGKKEKTKRKKLFAKSV